MFAAKELLYRVCSMIQLVRRFFRAANAPVFLICSKLGENDKEARDDSRLKRQWNSRTVTAFLFIAAGSVL